METYTRRLFYAANILTPHSLGKLVEWKPKTLIILKLLANPHHSLGKLVEWKPNTEHRLQERTQTPLSPLAGEIS